MGKMSYLLLRFGYLVGAHPALMVATSLALSIPFLSVFLIKPIIIETDIRRGFASADGRSVLEFQRFAEFFNVSWRDLEIFVVLIQSKDPNEMMLKITPQLCDEIQRLELFIRSFTLVDSSNQSIGYGEFEVPGGNINYFFDAFKFAYDVQNFATDNGTDGPIILSYPHAYVYGNVVSLASHFYGAKLVGNFKEKGLATAMDSVKAVALFYLLHAHGFAQKHRLRQWQLKLFQLSEKRNFSDLFTFHVYGDQVANAEMERANTSALKLLVAGVVIMVLYMVNALRTLSFKSQILLISISIASPLLATTMAFALIHWFAASFTSVMNLTPLLMLGIGVDDAFLLIHSWRHRASIPDAPKRMAIVVTEAGPSITITSVTNFLAFGIGVIAASPAMSLFCLCTSLAIALDYIFELTIFAPMLVIASRLEPKAVELHEKNPPWYSSSRWIFIAHFIVSKTGRITVLAITVILYIIATFGIMQMKATFDPNKTFPRDSTLTDAVKLVDFIYREYAPVNIVTNNPPDISNAAVYADFMEAVSKLESVPESYGPSRTLLWLRDYVEYLSKRAEMDDHHINLTYEYVPEFLDNKLMADKNVVRYHIDKRGSVVVDIFVFALILRGEDGWTRRAELTDRIRSILDHYPQYNMTVFDYDATIFDLITTVKREMIKAVTVTLACMTLVCFIFITNFTATAIASLTIFSIFYCLMGFLSFWGLDLDPITMIDVVIAIGFSVDFSAHICYHFHRYNDSAYVFNGCADPRVRKAANIYHVIGTPTIEAGISTILCLLPLFTVPAESVESFVKTMTMVVVMGIFHGIIVLPSVLTLCNISNTERSRTLEVNDVGEGRAHSEGTSMI